MLSVSATYALPRGPFRADQLRSGDPYELSDGHPILVLPGGGRQGAAAAAGAAVLKSDPLVEASGFGVGVDAGYTPEPGTLRAPDLSVATTLDETGWIVGSPLLAVDYIDAGEDERDLAKKIGELLAAGTLFYWIVRLVGPPRVEVHEPGRAMRIARPGEELVAPGVLACPVPVEALYDWEASRKVMLRNLLLARS